MEHDEGCDHLAVEDIYWEEFREHFKYDPPPMYVGHRYLCYQKEHGKTWRMEEFTYSGMVNSITTRQPMYTVTDDSQHPGPAGALIPCVDVT